MSSPSSPASGPASNPMTPHRLVCSVALIAMASAQWSVAHSQEITFERHIRPILRQHCFDCHGATDKLEGNLDLRLVRFIKQGGDSGAAIDNNKSSDSLLIQRIVDGDMPPGGSHLPAAQLKILQDWIDAGAKTERPEPAKIGPGVPIIAEDREYWAFRPISRPAIGASREPERVRTPIDALLANAMPGGISFSSDADRTTLIRRAYFDLVGLPPHLDDIDRWSQLSDANWFEQMVDALLDSPQYGERWARHWLDVAGYADSEGQTTEDAVRPWAWKYRDYVIRSLNTNKPFDRFIIEQLAGDELAGAKAGDWTAEQIELLTATGFLTMAADGTGSGDNSPDARNKVIADTIKIVSSSLLGVSVGCAQCHDHRYDPISQLDYYAMRAVFEPAFDWQQWRVPDARRVSLYTIADREQAALIEQEAQKISQERAEKEKGFMADALDKELTKYDEPLKTELRIAYLKPEKERSEEHAMLLKKYPSVNITPGVLYQYLPKAADELKGFDKKIAETRSRKPKEEFIRAMGEVPDRIPDTLLFHRGDHQQPKQKVLPADLAIAAPEGELPTLPEKDTNLSTSGRRLAYAKWLTSGKHPLVARVLVNRIWLHHFGQAIVPTPSDFGKLGTPPSNTALLDWLADEFMRNGWDLKELHRTIMKSTAWRQRSTRDQAKSAIDSENQFYWRKNVQRLDAEVIRDRMLVASGTLEQTLFGPPIAIKADEAGQIIVDGQQKRRSLYLQVRRSQPVAMLQSFDAPVMDVNCERRPVSTVATQSLIMMNGEYAWQQADLLATRAIREAIPLTPEQLANQPELSGSATADSFADLPAQLHMAWRLGYGRVPTPTEFKLVMEHVGAQLRAMQNDPRGIAAGSNIAKQVLVNYCHALLNSSEFVYVD